MAKGDARASVLSAAQQLLANLTASGLYDLATQSAVAGTARAATTVAGMAGAAAVVAGPPGWLLAGTVAALLAFAGLQYHQTKAQNKDAAQVGERLREILANNEGDHRQIESELNVLGFDLRLSIEEMRRRFRIVRDLVEAKGKDQKKVLELLEKHAGLYDSLERFILDNFQKLKGPLEGMGARLEAIEELLRGQPLLELREIPIDPAKDQMLLFYGYRRVKVYGREEATKELEAFAAGDEGFKWWLMTGAGGVGKSRLALEMCLGLRMGQVAGFLPREAAFCDWGRWQPRERTLIVVDYVGQRAKEIGGMVRALTSRAEVLEHPVRVLLMERGAQGPWYEELIGTGSDAEWMKVARHEGGGGEPMLELKGLEDDDIWAIFQEIAGGRLEEGARKLTLEAFRRIDPAGRPLFAAMAAGAVVRNVDIRQWDAEGLLKAILEREKRERWAAVFRDERSLEEHVHVLALATMTRGIVKERYKTTKERSAIGDLLPDRIKGRAYEEMAGIHHEKLWMPLEPDILGEYFVLEHLRRDGEHGDRAGDFREAGWVEDAGFMASFVGRAVHDFPGHAVVPMLCELPAQQTKAIRAWWANSAINLAAWLGDAKKFDLVRRVCELVVKLAEGNVGEPHLWREAASALYNSGIARGKAGDRAGELADYTAVIELADAPVEAKAKAYFNRGVRRGEAGDRGGEMADYTAVIDLTGAPAEEKAQAYNNRGVRRSQAGDSGGAIADFTAVIGMASATAEQKAKAYNNRGARRSQVGESAGALADYTAVIELAGAPVEEKAKAYHNRGMRRGQAWDSAGEQADYTAVIELADVSVEEKAQAYNNRGVSRGKAGDRVGALADYTAVIELADVPVEEKAKACLGRAVMRLQEGDVGGVMDDCRAVLAMDGVKKQWREFARKLLRGF
jgi:tetratricopeptide (TPR) repeat protein